MRGPGWPDGVGKEQGGDKATKGPEAPVRSLDFALSESWRSWPSVEQGVTWYDLHVSKVDSAAVWKMVPGWELGGAAGRGIWRLWSFR